MSSHSKLPAEFVLADSALEKMIGNDNHDDVRFDSTYAKSHLHYCIQPWVCFVMNNPNSMTRVFDMTVDSCVLLQKSTKTYSLLTDGFGSVPR